MDSEELLAQLADIHLPEAVGFWPPAPGWWVLAVLFLIALAIVGRRWWLQHQKNLVCRHALAELQACYRRFAASQGDSDQARLAYINEVNAVLRRVALVHYPLANVASLDGRSWVDFIRENGDSSKLDDELAAALSYGRFQTRCDVDVDALYALGRDWIASQYLGPERPAPSPESQGTRA
ncbi:MAG: DUF4381 domain-containing protein [Pseudohongiellaceae bacterium]